MIALVLATLVGATPVDDGLPFFTREEPHLEDARDALDAGDPDLAIEHARAAITETDDERAIVEFDVAQILVARARSDAQQEAPDPKAGPPAAPQAPKLDDARSGFERAAGLAHDPRLISEAQLAAGNAALEMGKLEDAISSLRRSLVADRNNVRARRNLQRALELKQQQPPPPDSGGGKDDEDKKKEDEKKDGEKGDPKDGDQQQKGDEEKKSEGEQKKEDEQKKEEEQPADAKDGEKKDEKKEEQKKAEAQKKKPTSKEEAKRVLQGIRSRERPLTPLEMRGEDRQRPKEGKDW